MGKHFAPVPPISPSKKRGCLEKSWYTTRKNARDHAKKQTRLSGQKISFYKCVYCRYYHLTSKEQAVQAQNDEQFYSFWRNKPGKKKKNPNSNGDYHV